MRYTANRVSHRVLLLNAVKYGTFIAALNFLYVLFIEYLLPASKGNFVQQFIHLLFLITLMTVCAIALRKVAGGHWSFGRAFLYILFMLLIYSFLAKVMSHLLNYADPSVPERNKAAAIRQTERLAKWFNTPEAEVIRQKEKAAADFEEEKNFTVKTFIYDIMLSMIFHFFAALVLGLVIRRRRPLHEIAAEFDPAGSRKDD